MEKTRIDDSIIRLIAVIIGGITIYLGYLLFIKGVTGQASISINTASLSGQLINAAPGLLFALSGVVIIVFALFNKRQEIKITTQDSINNIIQQREYRKNSSAS